MKAKCLMTLSRVATRFTATLFFNNVTIAHDKGKPVARQGRKAVNLLVSPGLKRTSDVSRLSGCRRRSEKVNSPFTALLFWWRYRIEAIPDKPRKALFAPVRRFPKARRELCFRDQLVQLLRRFFPQQLIPVPIARPRSANLAGQAILSAAYGPSG